MFNVSDTFVHETFMRYVDPIRRPLPSIISIDEVYLNLSPSCKYALVILDWVTKEVIDILPSRRKQTTREYFMNIPKKERDNVKFLVCDMYNPYINFTYDYFINAKAIVDGFHVLHWLLNLINRYINQVKKEYQKRDRENLKENNYQTNMDFKTMKQSDEVYILNHAKWVLLKNEENIHYSQNRHFNSFLNEYMDTYDWKNRFMALDSKFKDIKKYKDMYESFNGSFINDFEGAEKELDRLIDVYSKLNIDIFRDFAKLLLHYKEYIINSFCYIKTEESIEHVEVLRRISNGPIESFNNAPSSLRSQSHGVNNFEYTRSRIIWSSRSDEPILLVPKKHLKLKQGPIKNAARTTRKNKISFNDLSNSKRMIDPV